MEGFPDLSLFRRPVKDPSQVKFIADILSSCTSIKEVKMEFEKLTEADIANIEILTRGQSSTNYWKYARCHVITASTCYHLFRSLTNEKTKQKVRNYYPSIAKLRSSNISYLPAVKYGLLSESTARYKFYEQEKSKHIKGVGGGLRSK